MEQQKIKETIFKTREQVEKEGKAFSFPYSVVSRAYQLYMKEKKQKYISLIVMFILLELHWKNIQTISFL